MSYLQVSGVPRQICAEESLVVPVTGAVVTLDATKAAGCLMVRARCVGGPIRFRYLTQPTSTDGTPLYDTDAAEWTATNATGEVNCLATTGGFVLGDGLLADATLYVTYYR